MANRVEIEVTTVYNPGDGGLDDVARRLIADAEDLTQQLARVFDRARDDLDLFGGLDERIRRDLDEARREADRGLDDIIDEAGDAGEEAGGRFGDGLGSGLGNIDTGSMGNTLSSLLGSASLAGPVGAAAGFLAAEFGDSFFSAVDGFLNRDRNRLGLSIVTGLDPSQMGEIGRAAGAAWADGFGESMGELTRSAAVLQNTLQRVDVGLDLSEANQQAQVLAEHFGIDIPEAALFASRAIGQGLVDDTEGAFDLMIGAAQNYQASYAEIIELTSEFGTTFGELGISGESAVNFIGRAFTDGLVPTIDRAGELFEEFVIEVGSGSDGARAAVTELGLSFDETQEKLASGRGQEAIIEIAEALLEVEDEVRRNELAIEIFGAAIESATDKTGVIELIAEVDNLGESFEGTADKAVENAEAQATEWERTQRMFGGFLNDLDRYNDALGLGSNETDGMADAVGNLNDEMRIGDDHLVTMTSNVDLLRGQMIDASADSVLLTKEIDNVGDAADEAADEIIGFDEALAAFSNRFDADRVFRSIEEDIDRAIEAASELEAGAFSLAEGFDTNTEAGRRAEEQMEALSLNADELIRLYEENEITADQLKEGLGRLEEGMRTVAAQTTNTEEEADALLNTYLDLEAIDEIVTTVTVKDHANATLQAIAANINSIPRHVSIQVTNTTGRNAFQAVGGHTAQDGGIESGFTIVNEAGPELARLPRGDVVSLPSGSTVFTAEDSERMTMGSGSGGGPVVNVFVSGSVLAERDLERVVRDAIYSGNYDALIGTG